MKKLEAVVLVSVVRGWISQSTLQQCKQPTVGRLVSLQFKRTINVSAVTLGSILFIPLAAVQASTPVAVGDEELHLSCPFDRGLTPSPPPDCHHNLNPDASRPSRARSRIQPAASQLASGGLLAGPAQNCLQGTEHETWRPDDAQPRLFGPLFMVILHSLLYGTTPCYTVQYCTVWPPTPQAQLSSVKSQDTGSWHPSVLDSSLGHHSPNNRGNTVYAVHHFSHALSHRPWWKRPHQSIHPSCGPPAWKAHQRGCDRGRPSLCGNQPPREMLF